jgi:chitinase
MNLSADFNADGRSDYFAVTVPGMGYYGGLGTVCLGQADGTLVEWQSFSAGYSPYSIGIGDYDYDGRPDLMVHNFEEELGDYYDVFHNDGVWPNTTQLQISGASVTEGNSGTVAAAFTVSLLNGPNQPVTVNYATSDWTATAGSDYQAASGTLTFAPGETTKTITVLVNGDRLGEGNEFYTVELSAPTNAVLANTGAVGDILDDEPAASIYQSSVAVGNTGTRAASFAVTLSVGYDLPVTVNYATGNGTATPGSDYQAASGTLTFVPGETSKTVTVQVIGDRLGESNETFDVNLSGGGGASIRDGTAACTIIDDEPRISIGDVTKTEGKKNQTTSFTFTVTLSAAYDQPVTMSFKTTDGTAKTGDSDSIAQTGTLTFKPGETTKTITIVVNGDSKKEADE